MTLGVIWRCFISYNSDRWRRGAKWYLHSLSRAYFVIVHRQSAFEARAYQACAEMGSEEIENEV